MNKREATKDGNGFDLEILNIRLQILVHIYWVLGHNYKRSSFCIFNIASILSGLSSKEISGTRGLQIDKLFPYQVDNMLRATSSREANRKI